MVDPLALIARFVASPDCGTERCVADDVEGVTPREKGCRSDRDRAAPDPTVRVI